MRACAYLRTSLFRLLVGALYLVSLEALGADAVKLTVVARLEQPVGNIAFTPDGRIVFSHHPFFEPKIRVAELLKDGSVRPFPNAEWNDPSRGAEQSLDSVLGIRGDETGIVWMLDAGTRSKVTPKLVAWNTKENRLERIIPLPAPVSLPTSFHNDFVVDRQHQALYIADEGIGPGGDGSQAALVVVDLKTGAARRLLQGHKSVLPEPIPITVGERTLKTKRSNGTVADLRVGADGIVADAQYEWLYYAPLSGRSLYRVKISDLLNEKLSAAELASRVERYSEKPVNGGLSIDRAGNIYLTAMESNAVSVIGKDRKPRILVSDPELLWPDGVSYSPDGFMYVSAAQIHLAGAFNEGKSLQRPPYLIFKFKPLAPGILGE